MAKVCVVRARMAELGFTIAAEDPEIYYNPRLLRSWANYPESMNKYIFQLKFRRNEDGEITGPT
jgi:hypothetical protein